MADEKDKSKELELDNSGSKKKKIIIIVAAVVVLAVGGGGNDSISLICTAIGSNTNCIESVNSGNC